MTLRVSYAVLTCFVVSCAALFALAAPPEAPRRSRTEFAAAISRVDAGMGEAAVFAILGRPDDVRTRHDPLAAGDEEVWRYGTSGHLTFATLGEVHFDGRRRVQWVYGTGVPVIEGLPDEPALRRLLTALGQVPTYDAMDTYNPRPVIAAVNLLQPLGKEAALGVIDEFLRITTPSHWAQQPGREGVFLVLRVLFDVPDDPGHLPAMLVGAPQPPGPADPNLLPRFPIALEDDIPFLLVEGFTPSPNVEQPESHVAYFREHGALRRSLLAPGAAPLQTLEKFRRSPRWTYTMFNGWDVNSGQRRRLARQALRMLDTVYRDERRGEVWDFDPEPEGTFGEEEAQVRRKLLADVAGLKIRWSAEQNQFTFLNGQALPPLRTYYRREFWQPHAQEINIGFSFERNNPHVLEVGVYQSNHSGKPAPAATIRIFDVARKERPLGVVQLEATPGDEDSYLTTGTDCDLDESAQFQVELVVGEKSYLSPIYSHRLARATP